MCQDQRSVAETTGEYPTGRRAPDVAIDGPQDEWVPDKCVEFGERVPPDVDVDHMEGREGICCHGQHPGSAALQHSPRPQRHRPGSEQKAQRLRDLDRRQHIDAERREPAAQVVWECRIVIEEGIAQTIRGVRHPPRRHAAVTQVVGHLHRALE